MVVGQDAGGSAPQAPPPRVGRPMSSRAPARARFQAERSAERGDPFEQGARAEVPAAAPRARTSRRREIPFHCPSRRWRAVRPRGRRSPPARRGLPVPHGVDQGFAHDVIDLPRQPARGCVSSPSMRRSARSPHSTSSRCDELGDPGRGQAPRLGWRPSGGGFSSWMKKRRSRCSRVISRCKASKASRALFGSSSSRRGPLQPQADAGQRLETPSCRSRARRRRASDVTAPGEAGADRSESSRAATIPATDLSQQQVVRGHRPLAGEKRRPSKDSALEADGEHGQGETSAAPIPGWSGSRASAAGLAAVRGADGRLGGAVASGQRKLSAGAAARQGDRRLPGGPAPNARSPASRKRGRARAPPALTQASRTRGAPNTWAACSSRSRPAPRSRWGTPRPGRQQRHLAPRVLFMGAEIAEQHGDDHQVHARR